MSQASPSLFSILLNWVPAILLLLVYIFFLRKSVSGKIQKEGMELQRRQAEALERIAGALERRSL